MYFIFGANGFLKYNVQNPYGEEMVANGAFDDASIWSVFNETGGNIATFNGETITLSQVTSVLGLWQNSTQTTEIGKTYIVSIDKVSHSSGGGRINVGGVITDIPDPSILGTTTFEVVATEATSQIFLYAGYYGATSDNEFDNLSIKEVL